MEDSQWADTLRASLAELTQRLVDYLPSLAGALALVLAGWLLAALLRGLTRRVAKRMDWLPVS